MLDSMKKMCSGPRGWKPLRLRVLSALAPRSLLALDGYAAYRLDNFSDPIFSL